MCVCVCVCVIGMEERETVYEHKNAKYIMSKSLIHKGEYKSLKV